MNSLLEHAAGVEPLAVLSRFRGDFRRCLAARGDELFELADAVLCGRAARRRSCRNRWEVEEVTTAASETPG